MLNRIRIRSMHDPSHILASLSRRLYINKAFSHAVLRICNVASGHISSAHFLRIPTSLKFSVQRTCLTNGFNNPSHPPIPSSQPPTIHHLCHIFFFARRCTTNVRVVFLLVISLRTCTVLSMPVLVHSVFRVWRCIWFCT